MGEREVDRGGWGGAPKRRTTYFMEDHQPLSRARVWKASCYRSDNKKPRRGGGDYPPYPTLLYYYTSDSLLELSVEEELFLPRLWDRKRVRFADTLFFAFVTRERMLVGGWLGWGKSFLHTIPGDHRRIGISNALYRSCHRTWSDHH